MNIHEPDGLQYFEKVLISSDVIRKLEEAGVCEGDTVSIYDFEFDFVKFIFVRQNLIHILSHLNPQSFHKVMQMKIFREALIFKGYRGYSLINTLYYYDF